MMKKHLGHFIPLALLSLAACSSPKMDMPPVLAQEAKQQTADPLDEAIALAAANQPRPTTTAQPGATPAVVASPVPVMPAATPIAPVVAPSEPVTIASLPTATVREGRAANLRQAPSTQAAVLAVIMPGQHVQINGRAIVQDGILWYPVLNGDTKGWVASNLLG